ncbi:hypothetical protein GCM10011415_37420 [Salipiger pallidus]|uniref:Lipoyl-binding domain-containing protein n=1 Tax=Salipiger pallidus TaxID=1775170 RepID=A0A8J2ZMR2_9RHOB|nr:hypothetical protein [Salipiger pallidus]GGG83908.1 hypothetical protein GCM10011415_37420 [Salipiger pallidus]
MEMTSDLRTLEDILAVSRKFGVTALTFGLPDDRIELRFAEAACPTAETLPAEIPAEAAVFVTADTPGLFQPQITELPLTVSKGDILAFLNAGPVRNTLTAPCDGTVTEQLAETDSLLGWGSPAFKITTGA